MQQTSVKDLDHPDELQFQQTEGRVQRFAWGIILLVLIIGLSGLLGGDGPLSGATISTGDSAVQVAYQRFTHVQEQTSIDITVRPTDASADSIRVVLNTDYLNSMDIQRITPDPDSEVTAEHQVIYVFPLKRAGQPITITFDLMPDAFGLINGQIGLDGGSSVSFTQVVYP